MKWKITRIRQQISPGYLVWHFDWYATNGEKFWLAPTFEWIRRKVWEELSA
jgi:hypothetical protein